MPLLRQQDLVVLQIPARADGINALQRWWLLIVQGEWWPDE